MTDREKKVIVTLTKQGDTHEDWLTIIRFGLVVLLKDQAFLLELILQEAKDAQNDLSVAENTQIILEELGLKISAE